MFLVFFCLFHWSKYVHLVQINDHTKLNSNSVKVVARVVTISNFIGMNVSLSHCNQNRCHKILQLVIHMNQRIAYIFFLHFPRTQCSLWCVFSVHRGPLPHARTHFGTEHKNLPLNFNENDFTSLGFQWSHVL